MITDLWPRTDVRGFVQMLRRGLVLDLSVAFGKCFHLPERPSPPPKIRIACDARRGARFQFRLDFLDFFQPADDVDIGLGTSFGYLWWYGT